MAEPLAFLLPFDSGFPHSSASRWQSFDSNAGDFVGNDLSSSCCGVAAKMAFTQFLNCDSLRSSTPPAECRTPSQDETLAAASPEHAATMHGGGDGDKPASAVGAENFDNEATLLMGDARPAGHETASTSYEPVEVSHA
jgi:hypothetical protein